MNMPKNVGHIIAKLSAAARKRMETRAADVIAEEMTFAALGARES
jgi:hypothetical protein